MGKTSRSSSSKRKGSKFSSKGYTKKSSKNKRSKLKKRRHHGGSDSYSDYDSLSSTSDDSYRCGRSRRRSKKSVTDTKRRRQLRSSSSEDSSQSGKRKRSVGSDDYKGRRKSHEKKSAGKKVKREVSESSWSSSSFSTCQSFHSYSPDSEYESHRRRHHAGGKDKSKSEITKDGSKKGRHRSRSYSSDSEYESHGRRRHAGGKDKRKSEIINDGGRKSRHRSRNHSSFNKHDESSDNCSEEPETSYHPSNRLRSVITVVSEGKENQGIGSDFMKEEIVYDHDDYPSSKSNDSNDGDGRKEMTKTVDDCQREEENVGLAGRCNNPDGQCLTSEPGSRKNEAVEGIGNLESILRQKALENFRKFCREAQTNLKNCAEAEDRDDTVCRMAQSSQIKSVKDDTGMPHEVSFQHLQNHGNIRTQNNGTQKSKSIDDIVFATNKVDNADMRKVKMTGSSCNIEPGLVTSTLKAVALLKSDSKPSNRSASKQARPSNSLIASNAVAGDPAEQTAVPVAPPGGDSGSASVGCIQGAKPTTEDANSSKRQNEPQLEEKTMSVMRGGELVQVSYKVYIPKKTPALARRHLDR